VHAEAPTSASTDSAEIVALAAYGRAAAARATSCAGSGAVTTPGPAYAEALLLTENTVAREFLERRFAELR
jgi:predicted RNA polymerase sigma factor